MWFGFSRKPSPTSIPSEGKSKMNHWGGVKGRGLTNLFVPQEKILTADCCTNKILNKEEKPLLSRNLPKKTREDKVVQLQ